MPLYKLYCIASHYPEFKHIKDLVTRSATIVFNGGGAVRAINSLGTATLPFKIKRHKNKSPIGDYWTMHFDASPRTLTELNRSLRTDTRVLRWTTLKVAEKLDDVVEAREKTSKPPISDMGPRTTEAYAGRPGKIYA